MPSLPVSISQSRPRFEGLKVTVHHHPSKNRRHYAFEFSSQEDRTVHSDQVVLMSRNVAFPIGSSQIIEELSHNLGRYLEHSRYLKD